MQSSIDDMNDAQMMTWGGVIGHGGLLRVETNLNLNLSKYSLVVFERLSMYRTVKYHVVHLQEPRR